MKQYVIDAFSDRIFAGNPAAVCIMESWLSEKLMIQIARENNLSETAFAVREPPGYRLRWFTPGGEIDLCGHATLATAYVIMQHIQMEIDTVVFHTLSGDLTVHKNGALFEMCFPAYPLQPAAVTDEMIQAIGAAPKEAYIGRDLLCVFDDEEIICTIQPQMDKLERLDGLLLHVTAPGIHADCVSRTFAPKLCVPEDPVCGSGHCHIAPYWIDRLKKNHIVAYQASQRGGTLYCSMENGQVKLAGKACLYSIADLFI